jgi:hypothetical protein
MTSQCVEVERDMHLCKYVVTFGWHAHMYYGVLLNQMKTSQVMCCDGYSWKHDLDMINYQFGISH